MILRIYTSTSVGQAENYYIKAPTKEAYYGEGQEFTGYWGGKAAAMMGLKGRVDELSFTRLCNNLHPVTGEQLTPRMKENRRVGTDYNFNCPKSVSLAYAWTKDERIVQALRQAVKDTMEEMEELVAARVRSGRRDEDRITGNWVYGEFIHLTARPENGIPDPHLHIHCFVPNVTFDRVEKKWKAAQLGNIHDEADYFNWAVTMRLGQNLKDLGLEIEATKDAFEIVGISRELIEKFSRRTKSIEEEAIKRGITDPAEKAKLAALTRENKAKTLLVPELEAFWWGGLASEHEKALNAVKARLQRSRAVELSKQMAGELSIGATATGESSEALGRATEIKSAKGQRRESLNKKTRPLPSITRVVEPTEHDYKAVAIAKEHVYERASAVTEKQLLAAAFKSWCIGEATREGIQQVVAEEPFIRREWKGKSYLMTEQVLAEEKRLTDRCIQGKGQCEALNPDWRIEDETLNEQQRNAVRHVLTSTDLITGISGRAGVGKTTLLNEVRRGVQSGMHKLLALAPTSEAAHDVLRKEGFQNAETVAKLLASEALQQEAQGAVILVDEAGLLSTRQADRLFDLVERIGARLVLVGDIGQHHPVERGQAFDLLEKSGKMAVVEVTEIQRQKGAYKRFVEQVMAGDVERAFMSLDTMDAIFEMTLAERKIALANNYISAIERRETALVTAPTHAECRDVTEGIREALKAKKALKGGTDWQILRNLSWTDGEKRAADHYEQGQVVQVNGHVKGFALGEQVEVIGVSDGVVRVRSDDGFHSKIKALPLSQPGSFDVYERDTLEVCEGDCIRITGNGHTADRHRLCNRTTYTVDYISHDGKIVLENGWEVDRSFKHLDYGYVMTSHAAQGKTVDWVFVAQSAQLSSGASDAKQFYVSTTRGRKGVKVYTDSIELLKENVSRVRERPMATEILREQAAEERERGGFPASELLGQTGPEISEQKAEVLQNVLALGQELKITVQERAPELEQEHTRPAVPEREQEQEMVMEIEM